MISILVVDDSEVDRIQVRRLLQKHFDAVSVETAVDGAVALEMLESSTPDLVITDLRMPNVDGLQLVRKIQDLYPQLPVLLMTATGNETLAVEALKTGAASYVPKNELAVDLAPVIRQILGEVEDTQKMLRIWSSLTEVSFIFDNDQPLLTTFTHELRGALQQYISLSQNDCLRIATAVDEALANAYYHGNLEVSSDLRDQDLASYHKLADERRMQSPYANRRIYVTIRLNDHLEVTVRDEGSGFDPSRLPDPLTSGFADRAGGRGVLLMRSFMDEVRFNEKGNEVTLSKWDIRRKPIETE